jgi:hypothetical protein
MTTSGMEDPLNHKRNRQVWLRSRPKASRRPPTSGLFGYDAGVDYKHTEDLNAALATHCPDGIDALFDNTSGPIHDAVLRHINEHARIAICGTASYPSWEPCRAAARAALAGQARDNARILDHRLSGAVRRGDSRSCRLGT